MVDCSGSAGLTLSTIEIKASFWRSAPDSIEILECPFPERCLGGNASGSGSGRRALAAPASAFSDAYCAEGSTGPLCAVCAAGYRSQKSGGCVACEGGSLDFSDVLPLVILVTAVLTFAGCAIAGAKSRAKTASATKPQAGQGNFGVSANDARNDVKSATGLVRSAADTAKMGGGVSGGSSRMDWTSILTKAKILISQQQVLQGLGGIYRISWPSAFSNLLSYLKFLSFDFIAVIPNLECMLQTNFLGILIVNTIAPLAIVGVLLLASRCMLRCKKDRAGSTLVNAGLAIIFFCYPSITQTVFRFFQTKTFAGQYGTFLVADMSIDVNSGAYTSLIPFAVLMVVVWPIGVPLVIAVLLLRRRAPLLEIRRREGILGVAYESELWAAHLQKAKRLGDRIDPRDEELEPRIDGYLRQLTRTYRGTIFYFDVIEYVLQKCTLIGLMVFFDAGSLGQLVTGLLLCFIYSCTTSYLVPYRSLLDNLLAIVTQLSLFVSMMMALVIEHGAKDPPDVVGTILVVFAVLPTGLAVLIIIYNVCGFTRDVSAAAAGKVTPPHRV